MPVAVDQVRPLERAAKTLPLATTEPPVCGTPLRLSSGSCRSGTAFLHICVALNSMAKMVNR
jgi:hypothetical protein